MPALFERRPTHACFPLIFLRALVSSKPAAASNSLRRADLASQVRRAPRVCEIARCRTWTRAGRSRARDVRDSRHSGVFVAHGVAARDVHALLGLQGARVGVSV
eukprot:5818432-Pleurochrysis_carterae.AAC.1